MSGSKIPTKVKTSSRGLLWLVMFRNGHGFFGISLSWGVFCFLLLQIKPTKIMNEIYYFSGIILAGGLILQTLILLFNRFVHKIKYPFRMVFYFYLKTILICMIPFVLLDLFLRGKLSGGLWLPILVIFIIMRFKNREEIKKYKRGVSKEDFETSEAEE